MSESESALGTALKTHVFGFNPFSFHGMVEWIGGWGISRAVFVTVVYLGFLGAAITTIPVFAPLVLGWAAGTLPLWAPVAAILTFWKCWVWYVQSYFLMTRESPILLEVKMPREVTKSPRAMETALTGLWLRAHETTFIDRNWFGGSRPYFSFEIASLGGEVHFFIWTRKTYRNSLETNLYAQYPEIEIYEVEDYAKKFVFDPEVHECFATDYRFEGLSAHGETRYEYLKQSAYPIRTYVDFELDKDPKEEFKVDPFAQILEVLSSCKPSEQLWMQLIIRAHLKKEWKEYVEDEVETIRIESTKLRDEDEKVPGAGFPRPTWKQQEQIRSMERSLGKLAFEFGARALYIAPAGNMDPSVYMGMRWIYRPMANPAFMNILRPRRWHNIYDYPWQDFRGRRWTNFTRRFVDAYRRRSWFFPPWTTPYNITSVETLATIWHPPSRAIRAPGLQRIPSTKAEPPPNLPT